ncbi:hypothetical protein [Nocardioides sambongensis]|uniref:hypothetical protein n=1 Tax=Nocardioides sambongensis TaxID=2589074 RepID=UPI0038B3C4FE
MLGAVVGAGFTAFESMGYAFNGPGGRQRQAPPGRRNRHHRPRMHRTPGPHHLVSHPSAERSSPPRPGPAAT